jgi:hypothetical protein
MDTSNKEFKPSDFWPDAEKMLDAHFNRKRALKRWSIFTAFIFLAVGTATWWLLQPEEKESKLSLNTQQIAQQDSKVNPTSATNLSLNDLKNEAELSKNQTDDNTKNGESSKSIHDLNDIKKQQIENENSLDQSTLNSTIKSNRNNSKTASVFGTNKQDKNDSNNQTEQTQSNRKNVTGLKLDENAGSDLNNQTEIAQTNTTTAFENGNSDNQTEQSQSNRLTKVDSNLADNSTSPNNAKVKAKLATLPNQSIDYQTLDFMKNKNYNPIEYNLLSDSLAVVEIQKIDYSLPKVKGIVWRLNAYTGFFISQPNVRYANNPDYENKRNNEESSLLVNSTGIEITRILGKWNVSTGLEINQYGESTQYKNQVLGNIQTVNTTPISVVDSSIIQFFNYYQGNEYVQTQTVLSYDTLFLSDTTTTTGLINGNLPDSYNSKNRFTYIEIPIRFGYQWFQSKRISSEVYGGLSLDIFQKASGYQPNRDLSAFERIEDINEFRKYILNYRIGINASYRFYKNLSLTAAVEHRNMLQSVWNSSYGVNQRYRSIGLQMGLRWAF